MVEFENGTLLGTTNFRRRVNIDPVDPNFDRNVFHNGVMRAAAEGDEVAGRRGVKVDESAAAASCRPLRDREDSLVTVLFDVHDLGIELIPEHGSGIDAVGDSVISPQA